jgi:phosphoenolpyruvate-protein phosphotransferase (PTS system enzyme I)
MAKAKKKESIYNGLGVSPGIGIGHSHVHEIGDLAIPEYTIPAARVAEEKARLQDAASRARRQIERLRTKAKTMPGSASEDLSYLLEAYHQMLKDSRLIRGALKRIEKSRINAEASVQAEFSEIAASFGAINDAYIAARLDDIREVANRLLRILTKVTPTPFSNLPRNIVVIAEEMTPADTAQLNPKNVLGIATMLGGAEGHTAIMARALGIPAVLGATELLAGVHAGEPCIIDGDEGQVIVNPSRKTLALYQIRQNEARIEARRLDRLRRQPAITRDDVAITLQANVELPMQIPAVMRAGASGIGLLRSEFMFMNRNDLPSEDEQYEFLRDMADALEGRPLTIRTLDMGGDKAITALSGDFGDSIYSPLGLRGIRLSLSRTDVLETQFRAILRASAHGNLRILLPMVTSTTEMNQAREILNHAIQHLKRRRISMASTPPPLGAMIEIPGAALSADALARTSDFLAIGSNDLTMYTLAIDRADDQVAHIFNPLHPAVLRLIQFSAEAAFKESCPISICGEMAGDPRYTALLLGFGLRDLSMSTTSIPKVKQQIRNIDLIAANGRVRTIMDQLDPERISALLDDFNALL